MRYLLTMFLAVLLLGSCSNKYGYVPVTEFPLTPGALQNRDTVDIIYSSGGPDYNQDRTYYYQYIVYSKTKNDTVRVLCLLRLDFDNSSARKVFISADSEDEIDKIIAKQFGVSGKQPEKILYVKEHDMVLDKSIPTVIGYFAETSSKLIK